MRVLRQEVRLLRQQQRMVRALQVGLMLVVALGIVALPSSASGRAQAAPWDNAALAGRTTAKALTMRTPPLAASPESAVPLLLQVLVNDELASMTLQQKLGQMIQIETYYSAYTPDVDTMVRQYGAGAVIIYGKNMSSPDQLKSYIAAIQSHASMPLLVTMDEEGGLVDRLGYQHFNDALPSAQQLAATGDARQVYQDGLATAKELTSYGINTDLAPVVDVAQTPKPLETSRLFGNNPTTVDTYAQAFLDGLQAGGVIGCLKHWPGVGSLDIYQDPHKTLPTINSSLAHLNATDFAAFKGILPTLSRYQGMVMVTHVIEPAIDPNLPSSLSPKVVGILRNQLGYDGVIMTDNLYMEGVAKYYDFSHAAVMAVKAGDDIVANAWDSQSMQSVISTLTAAVSSGEISQGRIDQSVRRILTMKALHGIFLKGIDLSRKGVGKTAGPTPGAERRSRVALVPHR